MIKTPEITHTSKSFEIPRFDEIDSMTTEQLHWSLFCVDYKLKILKSHHQSATINNHEREKSDLNIELEKLEELKTKISDKLKTLPI